VGPKYKSEFKHELNLLHFLYIRKTFSLSVEKLLMQEIKSRFL